MPILRIEHTVRLNEWSKSIEEPAVTVIISELTLSIPSSEYSCYLFNFFLFCSLRQKIICTGHAPCETSPFSVTTTFDVYLRRVNQCGDDMPTHELTQRYVRSHPCRQSSPWLHPLGSNPSVRDVIRRTSSELSDVRELTSVRTWRVRLLILFRPSETTHTTTFCQPFAPQVFDFDRLQRCVIFLMTLEIGKSQDSVNLSI